MCTVIPFPVVRFTPSDVACWTRLAEDKVSRGLWQPHRRVTSREADSFLVSFPDADRPVFKFERDRTGIYRLSFNDRRGWHMIGTGQTAEECLAVWDQPRRRDARANRDAS
jgi:hypothetical protein